MHRFDCQINRFNSLIAILFDVSLMRNKVNFGSINIRSLCAELIQIVNQITGGKEFNNSSKC